MQKKKPLKITFSKEDLSSKNRKPENTADTSPLISYRT